jgi:hypothetical protein
MPNRHYYVSPTEVLRYLDAVAYPAPRGALIDEARRVDAPPVTIKLLERIEDRTYQDASDVSDAIGRVE